MPNNKLNNIACIYFKAYQGLNINGGQAIFDSTKATYWGPLVYKLSDDFKIKLIHYLIMGKKETT